MTLNSSFDTHNKYVGEPSTELDAAWQELWHGKSTTHRFGRQVEDTHASLIVYPGQMTEEEVLQSGNDPHLTAKWPEEYGGGYVFKIEAFHQMHCLVWAADSDAAILSLTYRHSRTSSGKRRD
jgi:hypothetical protein